MFIECPQVTSTGSLFDSTTTPTPTTTTTTTTTTQSQGGESKTTTSSSDDDDPFGSINPSKRRRRQAEGYQSDDVSDDNGRQLRMVSDKVFHSPYLRVL